MNNRPTPEQIHSYQENGFLVVENFLSASELDHWRHTTQEAVDRRLDSLKKSGGDAADSVSAAVAEIEENRLKANEADPDGYYSQVFTQCVKLADSHTGMREIMFDPRLG
ncbi:MAG: phytanoyl-CoA hydroxylase, partial [Abditibacteriota bacterium]|nr:phytanoyl-CoA hydroxylase [Abditibacteriota bacterium]